MEMMGHMGMTMAEMGMAEVYGEESVVETECIPEQQEEEEAKVGYFISTSFTTSSVRMYSPLEL